MGVGVNPTSRPLYSRERPGTNCTGGCLGHRAGLDGCGSSRLHRDSIPEPSLDVKFANTSQNITEYFDIHCKISSYLSTRFAIDKNRDIQSKKIDKRVLKVDTLVYNRECSMRGFFFTLSSFVAHNTHCLNSKEKPW